MRGRLFVLEGRGTGEIACCEATCHLDNHANVSVKGLTVQPCAEQATKYVSISWFGTESAFALEARSGMIQEVGRHMFELKYFHAHKSGVSSPARLTLAEFMNGFNNLTQATYDRQAGRRASGLWHVSREDDCFWCIHESYHNGLNCYPVSSVTCAYAHAIFTGAHMLCDITHV